MQCKPLLGFFLVFRERRAGGRMSRLIISMELLILLRISVEAGSTGGAYDECQEAESQAPVLGSMANRVFKNTEQE